MFQEKKKPKKSNIMAEISKVMGLIMKMPWKLSFGNWKHLKCVFSFYNLSLITQKLENWIMKTKTGNNAKQTSQPWDSHILSYGR